MKRSFAVGLLIVGALFILPSCQKSSSDPAILEFSTTENGNISFMSSDRCRLFDLKQTLSHNLTAKDSTGIDGGNKTVVAHVLFPERKGGILEVKTDSDVLFDVVSSDDWIHCEETSASDDATIALKIDKNNKFGRRKGIVVLKKKDESLNLTITATQNGRDWSWAWIVLLFIFWALLAFYGEIQDKNQDKKKKEK